MSIFCKASDIHLLLYILVAYAWLSFFKNKCWSLSRACFWNRMWCLFLKLRFNLNQVWDWELLFSPGLIIVYLSICKLPFFMGIVCLINGARLSNERAQPSCVRTIICRVFMFDLSFDTSCSSSGRISKQCWPTWRVCPWSASIVCSRSLWWQAPWWQRLTSRSCRVSSRRRSEISSSSTLVVFTVCPKTATELHSRS